MSKKLLVTSGMSLFAVAVINWGCHNGIHKPGDRRAIVEVVSVAIDDSAGNNDGRMNPGETVKMRLQLKNMEKEEILASQATLYTSQSGIRISQRVATIPSMASGKSAFSTDVFIFSIDRNAAVANAAFFLEATQGANFQATFSVEVRPTAQQDTVVVERNVVIIDTTAIDGTTRGNGDGQLSPGEKVKLLPELKNTGKTSIPATVATLSTSQRGIDIIDNTANYASIDTGKSALPIPGDFFIFEASNALSVPVVKFDLTGREGSTIRYNDSLSVQNNILLYACIDECKLTRNKYPNELVNKDELRIRLSICNNTGINRDSLAVRILDSQIKLCSDPQIRFFKVSSSSEQVYYGAVTDRGCALPPTTPGCQQEFIYKTNLSSLSGLQCVRFKGHIYIRAFPPNCSWTTGIPLEFKLCYRAEITP